MLPQTLYIQIHILQKNKPLYDADQIDLLLKDGILRKMINDHLIEHYHFDIRHPKIIFILLQYIGPWRDLNLHVIADLVSRIADQ